MENLKQIIESILFVAGEPVAFFDIAEKLQVEVEEVKKAAEELKEEKNKSASGVQVMIFNDKAQLSSNPDYSEKIAEVLNPIKEKALTKAVLEVCAIIAYKQPITRVDIENVRGVNSDYAINSLLENNLIEVVGRKDAVGKPLLFGTTDNFLKKFELTALSDLPDYDELIERIKVLHMPEKDSSLFNFTDYSENPTINDEQAEDIDIEKMRQNLDIKLDELGDVMSDIDSTYSDELA